MTVLGLVVLALCVGIYGTIIGAGGGFVLIPAMVLIFDFSGAEAVGTGAVALAVIGLNGALAQDRSGKVERGIALWFGIGSAPVALLAGWFLAGRIDAAVFNATLGLLLLVLALVVVFGPGASAGSDAVRAPRRGLLVGTGSLIGVLGGTFSVGGGLLTVPFLGWSHRLAPHRATATTQATASVTSIAAAVGHTVAGNVRWIDAAPLVAGALAGSSIGAHISGRLSERVVLVLLASGLVAAAVPLLWSSV